MVLSHGLALDLLNFFLADVRGGIGPYVNVFLLTEAGWTSEKIGAVLSLSGLLGIAAHAPIGAFIDETVHKRSLLAAACWVLASCGIAVAAWPVLPVVFMADASMAALGAVFAPTVAAVSLGIVGREGLAQRTGRNAVFDKIGNLFIAALAGTLGWLMGQRAVFLLLPFFALLASLSAYAIPRRAIDHELARGLTREQEASGTEPKAWRRLFTHRPFLVLACVTVLFHFANAPMIGLVSQKLALTAPGYETATTSAAVVIAQLATIPMAVLVTRADRLGVKTLLLLAFCALPLRGLLFAVLADPFGILCAQVLDGIGVGLFDALLPLALADAVRGLGRYNVSRGLIGTIQGVGGSVSYAAAGWLATNAGFTGAFVALSSVACIALAVALICLPAAPRRRPS